MSVSITPVVLTELILGVLQSVMGGEVNAMWEGEMEGVAIIAGPRMDESRERETLGEGEG